MNTQLMIMGEISFIKIGEYKGEVVNKLQFFNEDEAKGISILEVKLDSTQDMSILKKGVKVQIPVTISAMDRSIFYKQRGKILTK